jgi:hypothetical protein
MVFCNTGQKYHGILTLEKGDTTENYRGIFITLAPDTLGSQLSRKRCVDQMFFDEKAWNRNLKFQKQNNSFCVNNLSTSGGNVSSLTAF